MNHDLMLDIIADELNSLPMVTWDRYVINGKSTAVYGWIKRVDSHEDFVLLLFDFSASDEYSVTFYTSSAEYTHQINSILCSGKDSHQDCKRVEDLSLGIENVIKLTGRENNGRLSARRRT